MKIQHFKFNERGLARFFGPLEAKIMNVIWNGSEMTIRDVQKELQQEKDISFNAVMTVMNRLAAKGVLERVTIGRTSLYRPISTREAFLETQSRELTKDLIDEFGSVVVSHLLDALDEVDPMLLDKLEQKIKDLKKEQS